MTDLLYSSTEESLRESIREAISRAVTPGDLLALYDRADPAVGQRAWDGLAQGVGIGGLLVSQEHGGEGSAIREAAVVMEELGSSLAPVPFLTSSVIATRVLSAAGHTQHLPALSEGGLTAVLVLDWPSSAGHWTATALNGTTRTLTVGPVAGAESADLFIVVTDEAGRLRLRLLARDEVTVSPLTSLDMTRPLSEVSWRAERPGEVIATDLVTESAIDEALLTGAALLASEQTAIAQYCLDLTVNYGKTRYQFARPIGSFQAIKHRLADVYLDVVLARAAARYAADTLTTGDADRWVAARVSQSFCSDVAVRAAEEAIQLHGGIAMTWEHPLHLYVKRAKSDQLALGLPSMHRAELARLIDLT